TPANALSTNTTSPLLTLGEITVTAPTQPLSPHRLSIEHWLRSPVADQGLQLLGYSGVDADATFMAGDEVALTLFLQNSTSEPPARGLYLSLLNRQGNGVDGWEGWPLTHYPTQNW